MTPKAACSIGSMLISLFALQIGLPRRCLAEEASGPGEAGRTCFALELSLGTGAGIVVDEDIPALSNVKGGFFIGGKSDRVIFGVGFHLTRLSYSWEGGGDEARDTMTTFLVMPGIRVALVRSADGKVELTGLLELGLGTHIFSSDEESSFEEDDSIFHFTYALAPGLRYWAHPQFAVGGFGGFVGDVMRVSPHDNDYVQIKHQTGVFGSVALTGVF